MAMRSGASTASRRAASRAPPKSSDVAPMLRALIRVVADAVVVATVLFVAAGTLAWRRAWLLLAVLLGVRVASAFAVFRVNPALLRERATVLVHRDQPWADRLILLAFLATSFLGLPAVAALAVFR